MMISVANTVRTPKRVLWVLPILLAALPWLSGCVAIDGPPPNFLSTQQELEIGEQVAKQVEEEEPILDNPAIQAYVSEIGQRLAQYAPRQDVPYAFQVIDKPDVINAFAVPGGHIFVYTGLMKRCRNEAELASVLAHEIAHVARYHHGQALTRQYGYSLLMSILGDNVGENVGLLADIAFQWRQMTYSREAEREADATGLGILYQAGYNPQAALGFMGILIEEEGGRRHPLPIFASHPPTQERLQFLQMRIQQYPPRGPDALYESRYQERALNAL